MMRSAMSISFSLKAFSSKKRSASVTDRSEKSAMLMPLTVTASAVFFSLFPPQSGQGISAMQASISSRMEGLCVS